MYTFVFLAFLLNPILLVSHKRTQDFISFNKLLTILDKKSENRTKLGNLKFLDRN